MSVKTQRRTPLRLAATYEQNRFLPGDLGFLLLLLHRYDQPLQFGRSELRRAPCIPEEIQNPRTELWVEHDNEHTHKA